MRLGCSSRTHSQNRVASWTHVLSYVAPGVLSGAPGCPRLRNNNTDTPMPRRRAQPTPSWTPLATETSPFDGCSWVSVVQGDVIDRLRSCPAYDSRQLDMDPPLVERLRELQADPVKLGMMSTDPRILKAICALQVRARERQSAPGCPRVRANSANVAVEKAPLTSRVPHTGDGPRGLRCRHGEGGERRLRA